jgi:catechol 2,3-dioxygenase-like lactoylglutathione lyase family enzyme
MNHRSRALVLLVPVLLVRAMFACAHATAADPAPAEMPAGSPVTPPATAAPGAASPAPLLTRIRVATVATPDLAGFEARFTKWLGYQTRARGRVSRALAASWGTPRAAGHRTVLMSAPGWPDVYVRGVQIAAVPGYRPLTTYGWNGIEIIVEDPDALRDHLRGSPFTVIGEPANLANYPTIRAFQLEVPGQEVVYLTSERGDRDKSPLPLPQGTVGRPFIMVLAGPDIDAMLRFYADAFGLKSGPVATRAASLLAGPQGIALDTKLPITTGRLAEHGNLIEFDGYSESAHPRAHAPGELPPGVAMTSFGVASLDAIKLPFLEPPHRERELPYRGKRTATVVGAAGELIELIED